MTVAVEMSQEQGEKLLDAARRLNVTVEDLAAAAVRDLVAQPDQAFEQAARHVLAKNRELYRRLR